MHFFCYFCSIIKEWVGDLESETGGRIGLWRMCEKTELGDTCSGKLEEIMELPSMSFQVESFKFFYIFLKENQMDPFFVIGSNNFCWSCSHHVSPYNSMFNIHGLHEIYHSLSHLWMDANFIRFVKFIISFFTFICSISQNKTWEQV